MARSSDRKLLNLLRVNKVLMDLRPEMNLSLASAFIAAAFAQPSEEGGTVPTIKELSVLADVPYTSMSRHYRYLGEKERVGKDGLNLVEVRVNPDNRREKLVYLTTNGKLLKDQIVKLLP